jgi:hypothetical protein
MLISLSHTQLTVSQEQKVKTLLADSSNTPDKQRNIFLVFQIVLFLIQFEILAEDFCLIEPERGFL